MIQFLSTDYFVSPRDLVAGEEQAGGWEVCGGSAISANVADVGGDRVRDGHYGQDWAQLASGRCSGPPGAVITRNKM